MKDILADIEEEGKVIKEWGWRMKTSGQDIVEIFFEQDSKGF